METFMTTTRLQQQQQQQRRRQQQRGSNNSPFLSLNLSVWLLLFQCWSCYCCCCCASASAADGAGFLTQRCRSRCLPSLLHRNNNNNNNNNHQRQQQQQPISRLPFIAGGTWSHTKLLLAAAAPGNNGRRGRGRRPNNKNSGSSSSSSSSSFNKPKSTDPEFDLEENDNSNDDDDQEVSSFSSTASEYFVPEAQVAEQANELAAALSSRSNAIINNINNNTIELDQELSNSFLQYALSIILGRALPDARDGLKPVHRRILYSMHQLNLVPTTSHRKCARVVGEVLGKFHPHGDVAVYDALVRLAQTFSTHYPLIDGHGNFGSIDADPAAAMRYTECRLSPMAQQGLLDELEYDTVDFIPNFDGNEMEPTVLPAKLPILLLNGCAGIAVGMATNVPPHNLKEVLQACIALVHCQIEQTILSDDELLTMIPGPDFPTGASILGTDGAKQLYTTGHGGVVMRAITSLEKIVSKSNSRAGTSSSTTSSSGSSSSSSSSRTAIIVTELPYQVNKAALLEKIAALVNDKKLDGIADLRDESDRDGIRMVIELKRDAVPSVVLNNLYKKTNLQTTFSGNFLALMTTTSTSATTTTTTTSSSSEDDDDDNDDEGSITTSSSATTTTTTSATSRSSTAAASAALSPQRFTLRQALEAFLQFRFDTIRRKSKFQYTKVTNRAHIVDGLVTALESVDHIITLIKTAPDLASARVQLVGAQYGLSSEQAEAVLKLQLGQLTRLNKHKLEQERNDLIQSANQLEKLLQVDNAVRNLMISEFQDMMVKFGSERKTVINMDESGDVAEMDLIKNSRSVIVMTRGGFIKRMPLKTFESQGRGTRGKRGTATNEEVDSEVAHCFTCNDHDTLLMVTQRGIAYGLRAYQVPTGSRTAKGSAIASVLPIKSEDDVTTILPISEFTDNEYIVLATEQGWIKKTPLKAFSNLSSRGLTIASLEENDRLKWCEKCNDQNDILMGSAKGMAVRFAAAKLNPTGRTSRGVLAMRLSESDTIADVNVLRSSKVAIVDHDDDDNADDDENDDAHEDDDDEESEESSSSSSSSLPEMVENDNEYVLAVTSHGYGKRVRTTEFRTQGRRGSGAIAIKFKKNKHNNNNNDRMSCLRIVKEDDEILVITAKGIMVRQKVADIPSQGRAATGVTIQKVDVENGDYITSVSLVPKKYEVDVDI